MIPSAVLGGALLSLGQPPSQNPVLWNIPVLYDLCWSPDPQLSSRGLFEVGAPWTGSLAVAAAERQGSGGSYATSSRKPHSPVPPSQTGLRPDSPVQGNVGGHISPFWGRNQALLLGGLIEGTLLRDLDGKRGALGPHNYGIGGEQAGELGV